MDGEIFSLCRHFRLVNGWTYIRIWILAYMVPKHHRASLDCGVLKCRIENTKKMKGGKALPHSFIKKKFRVCYKSGQEAQQNQNNHSGGIKDPKCLAPAKLQRAASPLILSTMILGKDEIFRKTLALRSNQISLDASMISDAKDFLLAPLG
jgi:hypothetical protein